MTAPVTISGISSGIDTNSVIASTLVAASAPQKALKTALTNLQNVDAAYQAVNTAMAAVKNAADSVSLPATWQSTTATSSDPTIASTGSASALAGTATTFSVTALALSQVSTLHVADPANAWNGTVTIKGTDFISSTDHSAAGLASAINKANIGVKASVLATDQGSYLQFTSAASGTANSFSFSGSGLADGTPTVLTAAKDAQITVGTLGSGGYSVTSSSNTFSQAIPGVSFTVSALTSNAQISVASDASVASAAVSSMVKAVNSALLTISASSGQGNTLEADTLVTQLTQQLLSAVSRGSNTGSSFKTAGLDINSSGIMSFDQAAFTAAYNADPVATQNLVGQLSTSFSAVGATASDSSTGTITQAITSDGNQETALTKEISDWDLKLADKKTALTARYAAMESILSRLKSQSTYLTQAFGSINGTTSSK